MWKGLFMMWKGKVVCDGKGKVVCDVEGEGCL